MRQELPDRAGRLPVAAGQGARVLLEELHAVSQTDGVPDREGRRGRGLEVLEHEGWGG